MTFEVYAIRDNKIGFGQLMLFDNVEVAKRYFSKCINDPGSMLEYAAADYDLYRLGVYQTDNGRFTSLDLAEFVVAGSSVLGGNK